MSKQIAKRNNQGQFMKGSKHLISHGMYRSRFHICYRNIVQRCTDSNHKSYKDYGARGIQVEWKDFEDFKRDMYESYLKHFEENKGDTTIERMDNDKNYRKENCTWATRLEQLKHKRNTRYLTYQGKTQSMADWARELQIDIRRISKRLIDGWTVEEALKTI